MDHVIENKKSPYVSISYAIILVTIPILVSILKDVVGNMLKIDFNHLGDSNRIVLLLYAFSAFLLFYKNLMDKEHKFGCYCLYRTALKELKQEVIIIHDNNITEIAITTEGSYIKDMNMDIKSIKKFMGIK